MATLVHRVEISGADRDACAACIQEHLPAPDLWVRTDEPTTIVFEATQEMSV